MREDKKALTVNEFANIMEYINKHHGFYKYGVKNSVKYVRPNFDTRDGKCFHIKLDDKEFDSRDSKLTMYEEIMEWLKQ